MKEKKKKEKIRGKVNRPKEWPEEPSKTKAAVVKTPPVETVIKPGAFDAAVKADQPNLFGDQDRVYNVLQTRLTELKDEIARCDEIIQKKETSIMRLDKDVVETEKAIEIVRKQRKELKDKEAPKDSKQKKKKKGDKHGSISKTKN